MGEWLILIFGTLFIYAAMRGILHLFQLKRKGMIRPNTYVWKPIGIQFQYPQEWTISPRESHLHITTNDHDGQILISIQNHSVPDPVDFIAKKLHLENIEPDEKNIETFLVDGCSGASWESRATQKGEEDQRIYFQEWVIKNENFWLVLSYRCSVL